MTYSSDGPQKAAVIKPILEMKHRKLSEYESSLQLVTKWWNGTSACVFDCWPTDLYTRLSSYMSPPNVLSSNIAPCWS